MIHLWVQNKTQKLLWTMLNSITNKIFKEFNFHMKSQQMLISKETQEKSLIWVWKMSKKSVHLKEEDKTKDLNRKWTWDKKSLSDKMKCLTNLRNSKIWVKSSRNNLMKKNIKEILNLTQDLKDKEDKITIDQENNLSTTNNLKMTKSAQLKINKLKVTFFIIF